MTTADDEVDFTDAFRPTGPYGIAQVCAAAIAKLEEQLASAPQSQRKTINEQIRLRRDLMNWCKSRAGYLEP